MSKYVHIVSAWEEEMSKEEKRELFTERVVAGSRTYYFDLKESKDGAKYLVISETRQAGSNYEHSRVMVFEENLEAFNEGLQKALQFLGIRTKGHRISEIRRKHPKAYERWTIEEDGQLKAKFEAGTSIGELAAYFQRQPSAIRSRLARLGLLPT